MSRRGSTQLEFKVAEKSGWVSVYWGSRFPTTLPADQWERILKGENAQKLQEFISEERKAGNIVDQESLKDKALKRGKDEVKDIRKNLSQSGY